MPKETRVPSLSTDMSSTASPYPSTAETAKKNALRKLVRSVCNKKSVEETKCLVCNEAPHNAVIVNCSNIEKGCRPYMCSGDGHSNYFNQFRKSPASTPTLSCPQCGGEVDGCIVVASVRKFMDSIPRSCSVKTCEFIGNSLEVENHVCLEHLLVRPSVTILHQNWLRMRLECERDFANKDLHAVTARLDSTYL